MAMQRLDIQDPLASLGSSFGQAVGGSLVGGLDALAEHKVRQLTHSKKVQGLAALGLPAEYAHLDPKVLEQVVHQKLQEPSQRAFAQGLQSILGNGNQGQMSQPEIMRQQMPQSQGFSQSQQAPQIGSIFGGGKVPTNALPPQFQPKMQAQQRQQMSPGVPQGQNIPAGLNPQQAMQLAQLGLQKQALAKKEERADQRLTKKQQFDVQKQADKETLPYYTKVIDEDKSAKKIDMDTARMIKLIEKGNLPNPIFYKFIKDMEEKGATGAGAAAGAALGGKLGAATGGVPGYGVGAAIGGALGGAAGSFLSPLASVIKYATINRSPDVEEFEKLSANFISGAKAIFGSRVTDNDLRAFMLTVPQLTNTEDGKKAIIRNIQILNKASHARANAMKRIIKENNGHRPIDLALQVEESASPELDKLSQEFIG